MILLGKPVAEKIYLKLSQDIKELQQKHLSPSLAAILVGEDPASLTYVTTKEHKAEKLGINFKLYHLAGMVQETKILDLIEELNRSLFVHGIVIQLPLPEGFEADEILRKIAPQKDIDGFSGQYPAPTAQAIMEILDFYEIDLGSKKIVIVGFGRLVGKPFSDLLKKQGLQPIICTSSSEIASQTLGADIIISATGTPGLIKPEMVSGKAIIIDAGTAESQGKIHGDVDEAVFHKVIAYTPTPGGVGPVTVACLMRNLIEAAKKSNPSTG